MRVGKLCVAIMFVLLLPLALISFILVQIKAEDGGTPPRKSIARVRIEVLGRPDHSSHPPKFDRADMTVTVMEDDKLGSMVALLGATDDDHDKLWYNITGNGMSLLFCRFLS